MHAILTLHDNIQNAELIRRRQAFDGGAAIAVGEKGAPTDQPVELNAR